jgi:hypothetical protein
MNALNSPVRALVWEQFWKNRVVFPALGLLLLSGALLTFLQTPEVWWGTLAQRGTITAFLVSLLLGYVPFTLIDSSRGWRMNSMVTRWFVLPVRTSVLVLVPFAGACLFLGGLIWVWSPILNRLAGGSFDSTQFLVVLVGGAAATQALAWIVPRRPGQFWALAGMIFVITILFALTSQDRAHAQERRLEIFKVFGVLITLFAAVGLYAARRNRCGDWPGELRLGWILELLIGKRHLPRQLKSPAGALFWSDTWSVARAMILTWVAVAVVVIGLQYIQLIRQPNFAISFKLAGLIAVQVLPFLCLLWLAAGGLFLGAEPGAGFRTRLTSFRATLPVSAGSLAGQRILTALMVWVAVWIPTLLLVTGQDPGLSGKTGPDAIQQMLHVITYLMVTSAYVFIGALPLYLWGRVEGFPNILLCGLVSWASAWVLGGIAWMDSHEIGRWTAPLVWLSLKLGVCGWALIKSWRAGHITWRFAAGLVGGWVCLVALLSFALPVFHFQGVRGVLSIALFIPLARLALCPLALAANRSR